MSCALGRVNAATQVKINVHLLRRGAAKRGWGCVAPSPFAAWSAAPVYFSALSVVAARVCWRQKGILFIAATSRRRHEPSAPSPSRHRCRLRVVRANKKTMPDKNPGTGFFIATHHPGVKVRLGRCAFCLLSPAHPACQAARGRAALLFPAHLPCFPSAPRGSIKTVNRSVSVRYTGTLRRNTRHN